MQKIFSHLRKSIRFNYSFLILGLCILISPEIQAQKVVRNFSLPGSNNQYIELKDIQGEHVTVLDFWTSWCKPCLNAIPELIKLSEKYDSLGVVFIGVNADSPRSVSKAIPLAKSLGINYPIVFDTSGDLTSELNIGVFPTLIVMNSERKIIFIHEGFTKNDGTILEEVIVNALKN